MSSLSIREVRPPEPVSNSYRNVWIDLEITPEQLIELIIDRINWIKDVWRGKVPEEKDRFCLFMRNYCNYCKKVFFAGELCRNALISHNVDSAKNSGWDIINKHANFVKKDLPNKDSTKAKIYFEEIINFHKRVLSIMKEDYLADLIIMRKENENLKFENFFEIPSIRKILDTEEKKNKESNFLKVYEKFSDPAPIMQKAIYNKNIKDVFYRPDHEAPTEADEPMEENQNAAIDFPNYEMDEPTEADEPMEENQNAAIAFTNYEKDIIYRLFGEWENRRITNDELVQSLIPYVNEETLEYIEQSLINRGIDPESLKILIEHNVKKDITWENKRIAVAEEDERITNNTWNTWRTTPDNTNDLTYTFDTTVEFIPCGGTMKITGEDDNS